MTLRFLTWRLVRRGAIAWSVAILLILLAGASAFRAAYPDEAARVVFARSIGNSRGLDALYGPAIHLETVGGFVTWRYGSTVAVVVALWIAMATTRVLRGDEESGRAELLLIGASGPIELLAAQAVGLGAAVLLVGLGSFVGCVAGGLAVAGSAWFAAMVVASGILFAAIAALASQVTLSRRRSLGVTGAVLAVSYLVRAVGDGAPDLRWLTWFTPLGWVERFAPFGPTHSWLAVAFVVGATVAVAVLTVELRIRRDTGDSALREWHRRTTPRRLTSLTGLELVLRRGALLGWSVGIAIAGLLFGFIAADVARFIAENPNISERTGTITGSSLSTIKGFLGLSFAVIAVVAALYAGAQLIAARRDEETTTLDNLLTSGAPRTKWLGVHLVVAAASVLLVTLVAGLAAWAGVRLSGQQLSIVDGLRGAANTFPVSLFFLGLATAAFGVRPRTVTALAYGSVALGYALLIVTAIGDAPRWIIDLSPFSHLAAVPAAPANTPAALVLLAIGACGVATGVVSFNRRDIVAA